MSHKPLEFKKRADLNWCYFCWFSANIESATNEISERFLCLNCGALVIVYPDDDNPEIPRSFTDEEWDSYWEKNIKAEK